MSAMEINFEGKTAIVTGAANGIGREIAAQFAVSGAKVAVVDLNIDGAKAAAQEIGSNALPVHCNVSDSDSVSEMVKTVADAFGGINILVNNAGICERISVLDLTEEQWDRTMAVNLKGAFLVSKAAIPYMKAQDCARIINTSSVSGKIGGLMVGLHYTASKGGVLAMTKGLARELAPFNITVNSVCPAMVDTEMGSMFEADEKENYLRSVPLRRLASVGDVAAAVLYLASDAASYVTGEVFDVNGGILMD